MKNLIFGAVFALFTLTSFANNEIPNENLIPISLEDEGSDPFSYCGQLADWYMAYYDISFDDSWEIFDDCMEQQQ